MNSLNECPVGWLTRSSFGLFWTQCTVTSLQSTVQYRKCGLNNTLGRHQKTLAAFMVFAGWWMILLMPNMNPCFWSLKNLKTPACLSVSDLKIQKKVFLRLEFIDLRRPLYTGLRQSFKKDAKDVKPTVQRPMAIMPTSLSDHVT